MNTKKETENSNNKDSVLLLKIKFVLSIVGSLAFWFLSFTILLLFIANNNHRLILYYSILLTTMVISSIIVTAIMVIILTYLLDEQILTLTKIKKLIKKEVKKNEF